MRLESVSVAGFRSVEHAELSNCGSFNVLIGKNNSGKSSLLIALSAFFNGISGGNITTVHPQIGQDIDFHNLDTLKPIDVIVTFSLELAEREVLMRNIVTEAPQLSNAVEGLDPSLQVRVKWTVSKSNSTLAYVSSILLVHPGAPYDDNSQSYVLLKIEDDAASEILTNHIELQQVNIDFNAISRLASETPDALRRLLREQRAERLPTRYWIERATRGELNSGRISDETQRFLEELISNSTNVEELNSALDSTLLGLKSRRETLQNQSITRSIITFSGNETKVPSYVASLLDGMRNMKVLHLQERRERIGEAEAQRLLDLKVSRGGDQILRTIKDTVSALLGVSIDAFSGGSGTHREGNAELDIDNFLVQVNGAGVREALRVVLDYEFQRPDILLVEEPEVYLHPALEMSMLRYLRSISNQCQVFITTHSTNFLDMAEMRNVYLVSKQPSTKALLVNYEEAETQVPNELGMRLSSFFMYDRLVFVEGHSDEAILRELASTIGTNLSQANVGFISIGGARNFAYYAAEYSLGFLAKRRVKMWFLLDRDERKDEDVESFFNRIGSQASIKVLKKREIENYLMAPRAISDFIALKRRISGSDHEPQPSEIEIRDALEKHADELRSVVVAKRVASRLCGPVYPKLKGALEATPDDDTREVILEELQRMRDLIAKKIETLEEVHEEVAEATKQSWDEERMNVIQGDLLLERVCSDFGVRFVKEVDGVRLASCLRHDEISPEITDFLREIVG